MVFSKIFPDGSLRKCGNFQVQGGHICSCSSTSSWHIQANKNTRFHRFSAFWLKSSEEYKVPCTLFPHLCEGAPWKSRALLSRSLHETNVLIVHQNTPWLQLPEMQTAKLWNGLWGRTGSASCSTLSFWSQTYFILLFSIAFQSVLNFTITLQPLSFFHS